MIDINTEKFWNGSRCGFKKLVSLIKKSPNTKIKKTSGVLMNREKLEERIDELQKDFNLLENVD